MTSDSCFLYLFNVKREPEGAALANLAVCSVFGLVALEDFSYYGESQTCTLGASVIIAADTVVSFPYVRQILRGYASAVV